MGAKLGSGGGPIADINVTPLIDVVLVLLVVFMVVTPMLQSGLPVSLPEASQTNTVQDLGQHITVSIGVADECKSFPCDLQARWYVEQIQVDNVTIIEELNNEYAVNSQRSLIIKADGRLKYGQVREVMDVIQQNMNSSSMLIAAMKEE